MFVIMIKSSSFPAPFFSTATIGAACARQLPTVVVNFPADKFSAAVNSSEIQLDSMTIIDRHSMIEKYGAD